MGSYKASTTFDNDPTPDAAGTTLYILAVRLSDGVRGALAVALDGEEDTFHELADPLMSGGLTWLSTRVDIDLDGDGLANGIDEEAL